MLFRHGIYVGGGGGGGVRGPLVLQVSVDVLALPKAEYFF